MAFPNATDGHDNVLLSLNSYLIPSFSTITLSLGTVLLIVITTTRLLSQHKPENDPAPQLPYWLPYFGHLLQIFNQTDSLMRSGSSAAASGIFCLRILGSKQHVVTSMMLAQKTLERQSVLQEHKTMFKTSSWAAAKAEAQADEITSQLLHNLEQALPNFISGCRSPIDQMTWEKNADARPAVHSPSSLCERSECSFFALLSGFTNHLVLQTLISGDDHGSLSKCLTELNANSFPLALDLPYWPTLLLPLPSIHDAFRARRNALSTMKEILRNDSRETSSLDLMESMGRETYQSVHAPEIYLDILQDMTKDIAPLGFWTLLHLLSASKEMLLMSQREAQAIISINEPPALLSGLSIREPAKVKIDTRRLQDVDKVPVIFAHFLECVRLYDQSWTSQRVLSDFTLDVSKGRSLLIPAGSYMNVARELCNRDEATFESPEEYIAARFFESSSQRRDPRFAHDHSFVQRFNLDPSYEHLRCMAPFLLGAIASILVMWDIVPASSGKSENDDKLLEGVWTGFQFPNAKRTAGVALPREDFSVYINRKDIG